MRRLILAAAAAVQLLLAAATTASAAPTVSVFPSPGSQSSLPQTQIAFRGVAPNAIGTVRVVGSHTGTHSGHLAADSDGQGASFIPDHPFSSGETVTVSTGLNVLGGHSGSFQFKTITTWGSIQPQNLPYVPAGSHGLQHFRSRPDLVPAAVSVTRRGAPASLGDIFVAPQFGPLQNGPMVLDPSGNLVWFHPLPKNTLATDFRVQQLGNQPVLTWWQGGMNAGSGRGEDVIFDTSYHQIATVRAANGIQGADLHEFLLTPQGQAYIIGAVPVHYGGFHRPLMDSVVQEIDVKTGLVLFEWHALDHVPLSESFFKVPHVAGHVLDPYHLNSIALDRDGNLLFSMRNTWGIYKVDHQSGGVIWTLGTNHSSFKLGSAVRMAFQHNFVAQPDGTFTVFDDGAGPPRIHSQSRVVRIAINTRTKTTTLVRQYLHSPALVSNFEGGAQLLPGGDMFGGWGQLPYFTEWRSNGQMDFDAHFVAPTSSYRAYRFPWSGHPADPPAAALSRGADGISTVYASWNGATDVSAWRVLAGTSPGALAPIATLTRRGFETALGVHGEQPYFAVQALSRSGSLLASSRTVGSAATRLSLFGHSAFISRGGFAGLFAGCFAASTCRVKATVSVGRTVVASTGSQAIAAGNGGSVFFSLNSAGRALLARAHGQQLSASAAIRNQDGAVASTNLKLVPYRTSGSAAPYRVTQGAAVRVISHSAFVNHSGIGGVFTGCFSAQPCHVEAVVTAGHTVIARSGSQFLGAQDFGMVFFQLTAAGRSMLAHRAGNQLPVQIAVSAGSDTATLTGALIGF